MPLTDEERAEKALRCLKCVEPATKIFTINHPELGDHVHRMCEACILVSLGTIEKVNAYSALWADRDIHLTATITEIPVEQ